MKSKGTTGFELGNSLSENTLWEIDKLPSRKWPDVCTEHADQHNERKLLPPNEKQPAANEYDELN